MINSSEITALFNLIDDPDEEVYATVFDRICYWGCEVIPALENIWESTEAVEVQDRIEMLIHRLQYEDLYKEFKRWAKEEKPDLLEGAILTAKYCYPELKSEQVQADIKKINRSIWLELNDYLTPLEQFHILNSMMYHFFKLKGVPFSHKNPNDFLINKILECKQGNTFSNGIFFQVVANILDIPIFAIDIPQHYLLGFFRKKNLRSPLLYTPDKNMEIGELLFFIDASSGQMFNRQDMNAYLSRLGIPLTDKMLLPLSTKKIVQKLLFQLSKCYAQDAVLYKKEEIEALITLLQKKV